MSFNLNKCNCHSYNQNVGEKPNVVLKLPNYIDTGRKGRTVCIDACIVDVIKYLWDNNIQTLGCCCEHNKDYPNIVIESGYKDNDIKHILNLISKVDDRNWDIFQWKLQKVG